MKVTEYFTSYQGEGRSTGRKAFFLRLSGCDQKCFWCDSKHSWKDGTETTAAELIPLILNSKANLLVITGGEPLLQQTDIEFKKLINNIYLIKDIEIETNGTILPSKYVAQRIHQLNVSPKLISAGSTIPIDIEKISDISIRMLLYNDYSPIADFKFVIDWKDPEKLKICLDEIHNIVEEAQLPDCNIWLMPLGTYSWEISEGTMALMRADHLYNVSSRSHIIFKQR